MAALTTASIMTTLTANHVPGRPFRGIPRTVVVILDAQGREVSRGITYDTADADRPFRDTTTALAAESSAKYGAALKIQAGG